MPIGDRTLLPILTPILVGVAFLVGLAGVGFWTAVHPPRHRSAVTPANYGWAYEPISFDTADGLKLRGWLIPRAGDEDNEDRRAVMLLHGYPFDKGNILTIAPILHDQVHLLLFDFRGFGESDGAGTTFGYREQKDVLAAIDFLEHRGFDRIGAFGFSMGGATALMAAQSERLRLVISDSSYADLTLMTRSYYGDLPFISEPLAWLTVLFGRVFLGVDAKEVSPVNALTRAAVPALIIHSAGDDQIGVDHAHRLHAALTANSRSEVWIAPAAGHGSAFSVHRSEYQRRVADFIQRHL